MKFDIIIFLILVLIIGSIMYVVANVANVAKGCNEKHKLLQSCIQDDNSEYYCGDLLR